MKHTPCKPHTNTWNHAGLHPRLGAGSHISLLEDLLVNFILETWKNMELLPFEEEEEEEADDDDDDDEDEEEGEGEQE